MLSDMVRALQEARKPRPITDLHSYIAVKKEKQMWDELRIENRDWSFFRNKKQIMELADDIDVLKSEDEPSLQLPRACH